MNMQNDLKDFSKNLETFMYNGEQSSRRKPENI